MKANTEPSGAARGLSFDVGCFLNRGHLWRLAPKEIYGWRELEGKKDPKNVVWHFAVFFSAVFSVFSPCNSREQRRVRANDKSKKKSLDGSVCSRA
jgi:hypothetical protein